MNIGSAKWVLVTGAILWALTFTLALNVIVLYRAVEGALVSCYGVCPMGVVLSVLLVPYAISRALKVEVRNRAYLVLFVAFYSMLFAGAWAISANLNLISHGTLKNTLTFAASFASGFTAISMLISWIIYAKRRAA